MTRLAALALFSVCAAAAADWMQFRGANAAGAAQATTAPEKLAPENLLWRTPAPPGHSSPILVGGSLFLTAVDDEGLWTWRLDRETGKVLWRRRAPRDRKSRHHKMNNAAASTPASDGESVFVFFADFGLIAYSLDGNEKWRLALGPFDNGAGLSASPILADGKLIFAADGNTGSYLLAVDADNGEMIWKTARTEFTRGFSTPILHEPRGGGPKEIILPGSFQLASYSLDRGEKLWWANGVCWQPKTAAALSPTHVYVHCWSAGGDKPAAEPLPTWAAVRAEHDADADGVIARGEAFLEKMQKRFNSYDLDKDGVVGRRDWEYARNKHASRNGLMAVRLGGRGDVTNTRIDWVHKKFLPNVPSPLLLDGVIYMVKDGGIFSAVDAAGGEALKVGRLGDALGKYFASPAAADGKIYLLDADGVATVVRAGRDWRILHQRDFGEDMNATPAIADGRLYIRSHEAVYCFGSRAQAASPSAAGL